MKIVGADSSCWAPLCPPRPTIHLLHSRPCQGRRSLGISRRGFRRRRRLPLSHGRGRCCLRWAGAGDLPHPSPQTPAIRESRRGGARGGWTAVRVEAASPKPHSSVGADMYPKSEDTFPGVAWGVRAGMGGQHPGSLAWLVLWGPPATAPPAWAQATTCGRWLFSLFFSGGGSAGRGLPLPPC